MPFKMCDLWLSHLYNNYILNNIWTSYMCLHVIAVRWFFKYVLIISSNTMTYLFFNSHKESGNQWQNFTENKLKESFVTSSSTVYCARCKHKFVVWEEKQKVCNLSSVLSVKVTYWCTYLKYATVFYKNCFTLTYS